MQRDKLNPGAVVAHVRSGRKVNNDQVAISIDTENDDHSLHDDDDDKGDFKSPTVIFCTAPKCSLHHDG